MGLEREIQTAILLSPWGRHPRVRLWRANVGVGWYDDKAQPCRKTDPGAHPVKFGVRGQGDLSGIIMPSGRRLEIEVKTPTGRQSDEQRNFGAMITKFGGLYVLARSVADVDRALTEALK
jgi:hypothetical protein